MIPSINAHPEATPQRVHLIRLGWSTFVRGSGTHFVTESCRYARSFKKGILSEWSMPGIVFSLSELSQYCFPTYPPCLVALPHSHQESISLLLELELYFD